MIRRASDLKKTTQAPLTWTEYFYDQGGCCDYARSAGLVSLILLLKRYSWREPISSRVPINSPNNPRKRLPSVANEIPPKTKDITASTRYIRALRECAEAVSRYALWLWLNSSFIPSTAASHLFLQAVPFFKSAAHSWQTPRWQFLHIATASIEL
jgi:hypothetical protein